MADNQFNVKIVITDSGGAKLAEKNLRQLGNTAERTGRQHKQAAKDSQDLYQTQNKGIIGTANSTRSFSKLAQTIGSGDAGLVGAYATLAANIFAVTAAFNALRSASQVEQIFKGLEAAGIRTGRSLTSTAKALKAVTGDAINTEQAMRSTAQIVSAGFNDQAVKRLGQAARDTSFALGRNMTDSLDRLSRGVVKLEPELLDELGIMTKITESNTLYAASLGKTESQLTNFEKRQGFLNAVLTEAELKFGGLSAAAGNSTAYDRLASTFTDLANTVLNAINVIVKPIAGILADSMTALLGIAVLFASTLKNQLAPGLINSAANAAKSAQAFKESALAVRENVSATRDAVRAQKAQTIAFLANVDYVGNRAPKAYSKLRDAIQSGNADAKDYTKSIISLQRSIRANEALMKTNPNFAAGTARGDEKLQEIANAEKQSRALVALQQTRRNINDQDVENSKRVIAAQQQAAIATQQAYRENSAAAALSSASNFQFRDTVTEVTTATLHHRQSLIYAAEAAAGQAGVVKTALTPALIQGKTALYAFSLSARAAGAALLNAIPVIGQILFVLGLLSTAWDALKSEQTKNLEKAFADLGEVTGKASEYVKEMNRANASAAPIALRTAQAMIVQANAASEIGDKLKTLIDAQNTIDAQGEKKKGSGISGIFGTFDSKGFASNILQIDKASQALEVFRNELPSAISPTGGIDKDPVLAGTIQSLDAILKVAPKATIEAAKIYGGLEKIGKLTDPARKIEIITEVIAKASEEFKGGAARVEALQQAFKALDQAVSDFSLASIQNTRYDEVVKGFDAVTLAIKDLNDAATASSGTDFKKLLEGIPSGTAKFLDVKTQRDLSALRIADQTVQSLNLQKNLGRDLTGAEEQRLEASRRVLASNKDIYNNINEQINSTRQMFITAQLLERTYKAQVDLLNAHIQANQALYAAAGAGVRARIAQEERVRDLQKAQIQSELRIQEAMIARTRTRIEELRLQNSNIAANEELIRQGNQLTKQAVEQQLVAKGFTSFESINNGSINAQRYLLLQTNGRVSAATEEQKATAELISGYKQLSDFETKYGEERKANSRELITLENSVRDGEAAVYNLKTQIAVLNEQNLTSEQKLAQIRQADGEFQRGLLQTLEEQRKTVVDTIEDYRAVNSIINGTTDSLRTQIDLIKRSAATQRIAAEVGSKKQLAELQDQLALAKANAGRGGLSPEEKEAAATAIKNVQTQIDLQNQSLLVTQNQISAQEQLALAQKVYFDTAKEGLEWQRTSLDFMQKELDITRSLSDETERVVQAKTKLNYKRAGLEFSEEAAAALEIRTATAAYKLAVEEVTLKKALIDLEYALLDAQREQLMEDLAARKANIDASDPRNTTRLNQIDSVLERLGRIDLNTVAENAKSVLDRQVKAAQIELQTAITRNAVPTMFGGIISSMRGLVDKREARQQAMDALKNASPKNAESIVRADTEAQKRAAEIASNPIVSSNKLLVDKITEWIRTIEQVLKTTPTDMAGMTGGGVLKGIKDAFDYANSNGFRADELKGVTRVGKHSKNSAHYSGRAFDVNIGTGNVEANNPAMSKRMDDLAAYYRSQGFKVLWKVAGHFDHMHVQMTDAVGKAMATTTSAVATVAHATTQAVENSSAVIEQAAAKVEAMPTAPIAANDNAPTTPITVDGAGTSLRDFSGIEEALDAYKILTSDTIENLKQLGPGGEAVAAVFEGMGTVTEATVNAMKVLDTVSGDTAAGFADRFTAIAGVVSSALSSIQSALAASAKAKEDAIQREITAEQRRDGKSAESVAKIAALEKKKDDIARKQFNTNKKLMMAQAVIGTAAGIAQALGSLPPPASIIMAGLIGAMGAAQLAVIAGTSYQSANASSAATPSQPASLSIGKRGDTVDLAKQNNNVGGEIGYLRGAKGIGSNSSNYAVIGSAYGGDLPRGYGNASYVVGEKGPETITPETPITVRPANDNSGMGTPIDATFNIQAIDSTGVAELLNSQKGNIISMLREAANANGQRFLEDVDVNVYTRPNVSRL